MHATRTPIFVLLFIFALPALAVEPLTDPITSERPLFIFPAPGADASDGIAHADRILTAWQALPEFIRPYAMMHIESPSTDEALWPDRFRDILREMQFNEVPLFVSIANANPGGIYPLVELRPLLQEFTMIKGLHVQGLTFNEYYEFGDMDPTGAPAQVRWLNEAIQIAGEYGRLIAIELDELHWLRIMSNAWCRPLYDTIRAHRPSVVALNLQRGPHNITRSSALMGLWLEGAVDQWGLSASSQWYDATGFLQPGEFGPSNSDAAAPMPPAFYRAMLLNGALTGASVYRFPSMDHLWFGAARHYWDEAIEPTIQELLDKGYIARKDLVASKARIAYRMNPSRTAEEFRAHYADIDAVYGEGRMLHGSYGMERPGQVPELVPNSGRYYWIPILSPYSLDETLRQFEEVLLPGALLDAASWRERLDSYYTPDGEGLPFISRIGRGIFVLHTRENLYEEQPFQLPAVPSPVRQITAQRQSDGIGLSWPFREGDLFYRVYRRILPATKYTLIAADLDDRSYLDTQLTGGETVAYAITALTNEREPYEGVVNYGDYLVFNTAESRIDEEIFFDSFTSAATSKPILPSSDTRMKSQMWWPTGLESLGTNESFVARAIIGRIEAWDLAFTQEDFDAVIDFYADEYTDAAEHTRAYVKTAFKMFFENYRAGHVRRQIRSWDFSSYDATGEVNLVIYLSLSGTTDTGPGGRFADMPVQFPDTPTGEVRLTFVNRDGAWKILRSDPALPNIEDF